MARLKSFRRVNDSFPTHKDFSDTDFTDATDFCERPPPLFV